MKTLKLTLSGLAVLIGSAGLLCASDCDGWVSLFDGKTLEGWSVERIEPDQNRDIHRDEMLQ